LVKLHDGSKIVDIFNDTTPTYVILAEHGRVRRDRIKKMTPWIEPQYLWAKPENARQIDNDQAKAFPNICPMQDWVKGTFAVSLGGSGESYTDCRRLLDKAGKCPEHGKVRYTGLEYLHEKEDEKARKPYLRKTPPKRRAGGLSRPGRR
jgi:hypothetical protein